MLLRQSLYLPFCQCREIHHFSGNDPGRDRRMMLLQVFQEKVRCAALPSPVSDDYDFIRVSKIFRDLFVEGRLLGNPISLIMRFFTVDQVAVESKGIVWSDRGFVFRSAVVDVLIKTGGVMIDDHNGSSVRVGLGRRSLKPGFAQKLAKTGNLFHFEIVAMGTLKECALRPNHKCELVVSVWLDFTYLSNQVKDIAPRQITRKFAIEQATQQNLEVVTDMSVH
jgi:hypothetical protein